MNPDDLSGLRHGHVLREKMRIDGERVGCDRVIEVRSPWNGALVGTVPKGTVEDVRHAFSVARAYRPKLTRYERQRILMKTGEIMRTGPHCPTVPQTATLGACYEAILAAPRRAGAAAIVDDDGKA